MQQPLHPGQRSHWGCASCSPAMPALATGKEPRPPKPAAHLAQQARGVARQRLGGGSRHQHAGARHVPEHHRDRQRQQVAEAPRRQAHAAGQPRHDRADVHAHCGVPVGLEQAHQGALLLLLLAGGAGVQGRPLRCGSQGGWAAAWQQGSARRTGHRGQESGEARIHRGWHACGACSSPAGACRASLGCAPPAITLLGQQC